MTKIETTATVSEEGTLTIRAASELSPGEHPAIVIVDDAGAENRPTPSAPAFGTSDPEPSFRSLAAQWRAETAALSSVQQMVLHPAYQRIIGLGPAVIPLLLQELRREPDHWFWALHAITGETPVGPNSTFDEAVAAWLEWGRSRGLVD